MKRALILLCAGLSAVAGNLITNGGFADGKAEWGLPDNAVIDSTTAAPAEDGNKNSLKVTSAARCSGIGKMVYVAPDAEYDLTVWIKLKDAAATHIKITWRTSGNAVSDDSFPIPGLPGNQDWTQYKRRVRTPKHAHNAIIVLMSGADDGKVGTSWYDELAFTPVDAANHEKAMSIFADSKFQPLPLENAMKPSGKEVILKGWRNRPVVISAKADGQDRYAANMLAESLGRIFECKINVVEDGANVSAPFMTMRSGAPQLIHFTLPMSGLCTQMIAVMYETSARLERKNFWSMLAMASGPIDGIPSVFTRFFRNDCTAVMASAALVPCPWMSPST